MWRRGKAGQKRDAGLGVFQSPPTSNDISLRAERIVSRAVPEGDQPGNGPRVLFDFRQQFLKLAVGSALIGFREHFGVAEFHHFRHQAKVFRGLKEKRQPFGIGAGMPEREPRRTVRTQNMVERKGTRGRFGIVRVHPELVHHPPKGKAGICRRAFGRVSHMAPTVGRQSVLGVKEPFPVLFLPMTVKVDAVKIIRIRRAIGGLLYHTLPSEKMRVF
jgi:hypothetical protein